MSQHALGYHVFIHFILASIFMLTIYCLLSLLPYHLQGCYAFTCIHLLVGWFVGWLVGWLVGLQRYTNVTGFPQSLDGGWILAQNRPHEL